MIKQEIKNWIICPTCDNTVATIDHLLTNKYSGSFGPWYCNSCGIGVCGEVKEGILISTRSNLSSIKKDVLVLLKHYEIDDLFIVVKGMCFGNKQEEEQNLAYYYNEHTCPVNYLGVDKIIYKGDSDVHGLFEYVKHVDYIELDCNLTTEQILNIFND